MADGFRLSVLVGGAVLVAGITYLRFCGEVSLPPKPPVPAHQSESARQLLLQSAASPQIYLDYLSHDATAAGVHAPTLDDMERAFVDRVDTGRHVLEIGQPPLETAGVRLTLKLADDQIVMQIDNLTGSNIAYFVQSTPSLGDALCSSARPLAFNAMIVRQGASETRTECVYRSGFSIAVTRVETMELSPLSSWYVSQVPPATVGVEDRIARGHRRPESRDRCTGVLAQAVRGGMDRGQISWRDLIDFYARHRCQTYQFPAEYRAFTKDHERPIPVPDRQP
jgi:hypothetical protein